MADLNVTFVLPSGGARTAEVPDDVAVRDLMTELISMLNLPTIGPDGRPMSYRMDSKALGRELKENETLADGQVPDGDRLMLTADITAGAGTPVTDTPRMRRLRGDYELMRELDARSDLISFKSMSPNPNMPPERYIVTFQCKSVIGVDRGATEVWRASSGGDLSAQPVSAPLAGDEVDDPDLASQHQSP
jgi:hypothetical protein